jgi:hypothetical protein
MLVSQVFCDFLVHLVDECTDVPWLVIFDNVDTQESKEVLNEFWPGGERGSVLITSRDGTFNIKAARTRHLPRMDETSSVELLLNSADLASTSTQVSHEEQSAARSIVRKVGYVPIAINQAAQLIMSAGNSLNPIAEFDDAYSLRELLEDSEDASFTQMVMGYQHTLATVWEMSFKRLDLDQIHLLNVMSFLDPDRVQLSILKQVVQQTATTGAGLLKTDRAFIRARAGLLKCSLIEQNEQLGQLRIHRVIQASCHLHMDEPTYQQAFATAFGTIEACWPVTPAQKRHDKGLWTEQQACLEHVQSLSQHFRERLTAGKKLSVDALRLSDLLQHAAW